MRDERTPLDVCGEAKESALFVHDERPEQISVDITEEVKASSER